MGRHMGSNTKEKPGTTVVKDLQFTGDISIHHIMYANMIKLIIREITKILI